jgi:hypothetical protein
MTSDKKKIIYSIGAKGGSGKTTALVSLADFFHGAKVPVTLIDADVENRVRGSFANFFNGTPKIDIRSKHGLDDFVDRVTSDHTQLVLADMGAGSGRETFRWFDDMYEPLREAGIVFLGVGVVTGEAATVDTVLHWASTLKSRTEYLIIRNHRNGSDFHYLEASESGKQFLKVAKPTIIDMEERIEDIQEELGNRGLSLRRALDASSDITGPLLSKFSSKVRMRGYLTRIENQFKKIIDTLLP